MLPTILTNPECSEIVEHIFYAFQASISRKMMAVEHIFKALKYCKCYNGNTFYLLWMMKELIRVSVFDFLYAGTGLIIGISILGVFLLLFIVGAFFVIYCKLLLVKFYLFTLK